MEPSSLLYVTDIIQTLMFVSIKVLMSESVLMFESLIDFVVIFLVSDLI